MKKKKGLFFILLVVIVVIILILTLCLNRKCTGKRPPIILRTSSGVETTEFQPYDSILFDAVDLSPRTGYSIEIARDDGKILRRLRLSTDQYGRIPETIIWYNIGVRPCGRAPLISAAAAYPITAEDSLDSGIAGNNFTLRIIDKERIVREMTFSVSAGMLRPILYAADARGCLKSGFLIGEEDVWVVGKNFPKGSIVRVWAVPASADWREGDPLKDMTKQFEGEIPPLFELKGTDTSFRKLLWPKGLESIGSYDIVAEVVVYPFGSYHAETSAKVQNVVCSLSYSGFVIQRRPGTAEPLEMDIAGTVQSPYTFKDTFLTGESVYVGVDPCIQPSFVGDTANIYIVADKSDAQWTQHVLDLTDILDDDDVTGAVETITVGGICGNCWKTLAWSPDLTTGKYDVVLDFDNDKRYTPGNDLIDGLDKVGFTVAEVRVDTISFNYAGSGAVTISENTSGVPITAPEYVAGGLTIKPAAWIMNGSYSVQATFKADSSVASAQVWAETGMGGLNSSASPVTITFTGGSGQGTFTVDSVPTAVGKHSVEWNWKYKNVNGAPSADLDMGKTGNHIVYTVLGTPQAPQAVPWVGTLEIACTLAGGMNTADSAMREIWDDFYNNAGGIYDTAHGSPQYTGSTTESFNLTNFIVNYGSGSIGTVNCYDMGKSVVVFANALGCSGVYTYVGPFGYLNCVKPIGRGWANNPFYDNDDYDSNPLVGGDTANDGIFDNHAGRSAFGNHGFSRLAGYIFDASGGQVDVDGDPDFGPPFTARLLDGHDTWSNLYQTRVIDNNPPYATAAPIDYSFSVF